MNRASIPWNAKQVHKMVVNNCLVFDNAVQRGFVWDKKRSSLLIDSMIREYPIPPIYAIKTDRKVRTPKGDVSVYDVIDGKQRNLTIAGFKNNEFALSDLESFVNDNGENVDLNGLKYDELPDEFRDKFDAYTLNVIFFVDVTDDEITEIMSRLNNGKAMTNIEKTRISAADLSGIQSLSRKPFLAENLSKTSINGYNDEDIIVKMAMLVTADTDAVSLDNKDVKVVFKTLDFTADTKLYDKIQKILDVMEDVHNIMTGIDKKAAKKFISKVNMLSTVRVIDRAIEEGHDNENIAKFLVQFFDGKPSSSEAYNEACSNGTNHAANVEIRHKALNDEYEWYFNGETDEKL